jgi:hypothetical protein
LPAPSFPQYLCALKYCLNIIMVIEFKDCGKGSSNPKLAQAMCDNLLDTNDVVKGDTGAYIGVLFALFLGFRILGAVVLTKKAESFY